MLTYNPQTGELEESGSDDFVYDFGYGDTPAQNDDYDFWGSIGINPDTTMENWQSPSNAQIESALQGDATFSGLLRQYGTKALDMFKTNGAYDPKKLLTLGLGAYAASRPNNVAPTGYQGKIPKYTASRNMLTAPPEGRRPGSGGIDYGGGVTFFDKAGGIASTSEAPKTVEGLYQTFLGRGADPQGLASWNQSVGDKITPDERDRFIQSANLELAARRNPQPAVQPTEEPENLAKGGLVSDGFVVPADVVSHLGNGSSEAGLKLLASKLKATPIKGDGDGMSDSIPTKIDGVQEARVANEEAFISPEMVERLGNGDSKKGAKKLYAMMDQIRKDRTGTTKQGKQIEPDRYMPGGLVEQYQTGGTTTRTMPTGATGSESSLSNWAGDYVTDMLGRGSALAQAPYQAYTGPLTAGPSALQQQAFDRAANLQSPAAVNQAASMAGGIAAGLVNAPAYSASRAPSFKTASAGNVSSSFKAPAAYKAATFENQFKAPTQGTEATQFTNQFVAPEEYEASQFQSGLFDTDQARRYMNPYLQASLDPQLAEARRQSDISRVLDAGRLTQAGAFGGSRQAIMEAEGRRNLGTKLADITGAGYNTAYANAMAQFNADQNRSLTAQEATERSRQFGAGQRMDAAKMQAQYGLSAQQAQELARQFNQGQSMTAAQLQAQYGMSAQQAQEASRQFAAQQALTAATTAGQQKLQAGMANQQAGLTASGQNITASLEAARQQEQSRQFGANLGLQSQQAALQAALAQGNLGNMGFQNELSGINALAGLGGTQRGIESEGIAADRAQFEEARLNPFKMIQFEQSLLSGLPLQSQSYTMPAQSNFKQFASGAATAQQLMDILSDKTPAAPK
jgi:hypothetical protein